MKTAFRFEALFEGVSKLTIPFDCDFTSAFLFVTDEGSLLLDCGTTREDVEGILLPALEEAGVRPTFLAVSHDHSDHSGGFPWLREAFSEAETLAGKASAAGVPCRKLADGEKLLGCLRVLSLPGHTADAIGILDERTNSVVTCDAIQLYGVMRWGTGVTLPGDYCRTHAKLAALAPENLATSHEYYALGSTARGGEAVQDYLAESLADFGEVTAFVLARRETPPDEIAKEFDRTHPGYPNMQACTAEAILKNAE